MSGHHEYMHTCMHVSSTKVSFFLVLGALVLSTNLILACYYC